MEYKTQNRRMAIISNPRGGYNTRKGMVEFESLVEQYDIPHAKAVNSDEVFKALRTLAVDKPELLVINGGDGTVDMVLSFIRNQNVFKKEPVLALLKGGTTNLIHRDIGLKDAPHKALKKIINGNSQITEHRPLEIRYTGQDNEPLHGFFLGTGAIPRAILKTRETLHEKGMNGPFSEIFMLFKLLVRLALKRSLSGDEILNPTSLVRNKEKKDHIFLVLSTLKKLIPFIKSPATDKQAGVIYMGANRKLNRDRTDRMTIETQDPWVLDGEMQKAGLIEIKLGAPVQFLGEGSRR